MQNLDKANPADSCFHEELLGDHFHLCRFLFPYKLAERTALLSYFMLVGLFSYHGETDNRGERDTAALSLRQAQSVNFVWSVYRASVMTRLLQTASLHTVSLRLVLHRSAEPHTAATPALPASVET